MFLTWFTGFIAAFVTGAVCFGLGVEWAERQQAQNEQNRRDWEKAFDDERRRINERAISDAAGYGFNHPEYRKGPAPDFVSGQAERRDVD